MASLHLLGHRLMYPYLLSTLTSLTFLFSVQKVLVSDRTFYFQAQDNSDKEAWIGALGKAMIKSSVMIDDNMDNVYM